ncbi:MAG: DUF3037 domain-containing protein [Dehalococcoidia bacterium]|jgi:hypothetical protein
MVSDAINYYSIIRYVPEPLRGEQINVGVIAVSRAGTSGRAKFPRRWTRAKQFGKEDVTFLGDFSRSLNRQLADQLSLFDGPGRWNLDRLEKLSGEWSNSIQISEPRASTLPLDQLLEDIYVSFVKEPSAQRRELRDRRVAANEVIRAAKKALRESYGQVQAEQLVKPRDFIDGRYGQYKFDLVIRNQIPLFAAEGLSFEVPESADLERDVHALAWAIDDVLPGKESLKLAVIALPPKGRQAVSIYKKAKEIYTSLGARFVVENEIGRWADEIAADVKSHIPSLATHRR